MANLVLTVIGDDKAGLVDALASAIAQSGGNWERSHMAELAGKFAGIVLVTVPDNKSSALIAALEPLESQGLLDITAMEADPQTEIAEAVTFTLELVGQDRPGIVREISRAMAERNVNIDELRTRVTSAPMAGGTLFEAQATLEAPAELSRDELQKCLEDLANELMVDIELSHP